jgi:hypothetical protein
MAAHQRPQHRRSSLASGIDGAMVAVTLRCGSCQTIQEEPLDAFARARDAVASVTCLYCGRLGMMRMVKG